MAMHLENQFMHLMIHLARRSPSCSDALIKQAITEFAARNGLRADIDVIDAFCVGRQHAREGRNPACDADGDRHAAYLLGHSAPQLWPAPKPPLPWEVE